MPISADLGRFRSCDKKLLPTNQRRALWVGGLQTEMRAYDFISELQLALSLGHRPGCRHHCIVSPQLSAQHDYHHRSTLARTILRTPNPIARNCFRFSTLTGLGNQRDDREGRNRLGCLARYVDCKQSHCMSTKTRTCLRPAMRRSHVCSRAARPGYACLRHPHACARAGALEYGQGGHGALSTDVLCFMGQA